MAKPYFLRNIVPRRESRREARPLLGVLAGLTWIQWAHFFTGWLAWTCDAIDFYSVSLSVGALQTEFHRSTSVITTTITLTLLFRPVGAAIFGIISDRFGRKWPLVANLILLAVLQLGAGFSQTFKQFLALRALFGIGMGGIWGLGAATALENLPVEARGLASGVVQQGYAIGCLLAACINIGLVPNTTVGWRSLFWTASGISLFAAFVTALVPESHIFVRARAAAKAKGLDSTGRTRVFLRETKMMLRRHWVLCIYAFLFSTGFNFLAHGSQDLYPTYLQTTKNFTAHNASVATILGNCGALAGGIVAGSVSQYIGRRLTIVIFGCIVAAFIPLWILPSTFPALAAGAFCIQFGVQGLIGVVRKSILHIPLQPLIRCQRDEVPVYLAEISPPGFRATFPGTVYQLGNMASSAASQIEATGGENLRTTVVKDGKVTNVPDYAKARSVQGIVVGAVVAFTILVVIFGPENHSLHFEKQKVAFEEGVSQEDAIVEPEGHQDEKESSSSRQQSLEEKIEGSARRV
ncbi:carboxylic acid transporter [Collybia nuda]|uniref:Carboxylic acid transporter n=1 Tax=Collybia nuda TaxID=64659 RepID=A0A9P5Y001_9AGAR|nr:carboxylic acid transporter [Collybia nuda]